MSMWYPPVFGSHWVYLVYRSTPWQQEKKGDLVLYSGDLFPTEARKPPSCPRSHTFRKSKGEAYSSISSSRRSVRFYEASKHSSLALINQELCRHSLRLPVVSDTSFILSHAAYHTPTQFLRKGKGPGMVG